MPRLPHAAPFFGPETPLSRFAPSRQALPVQWTPTTRPPERLDAGDLLLDRWRAGDEADLYASVDASRAHLERFMPWSIGYELIGTQSYLEAAAEGWAAGTSFDYRLSLDDSAADPGADRVLGNAGLMARNGPGVLEIGYWVRADAVRRGIAARAAAALTAAGLRLGGVERIEIHHDPANEASAGIPRRLGYTRADALVPGPPGREHERHVCWVLTRDAWAATPIEE